MSKCLTLVHLTTVFRIDSGSSGVVGQELLVFSTLVTALLGGCFLLIGSVAAATAATGAVGPYWPSSLRGHPSRLMPLESGWTSAFVEAQRRSVCQRAPSQRSADSQIIGKFLHLRSRRCYWRHAPAKDPIR